MRIAKKTDVKAIVFTDAGISYFEAAFNFVGQESEVVEKLPDLSQPSSQAQANKKLEPMMLM